MSLAQIKDEVAAMTEREQRELFGYMISLRDTNDKELKRSLARKIDDNNPANWMNMDEFSERLSALDENP
ncbi:MAG: hypothetical protein ACI8UO_002894 [Verrucomicrobiales bacterium]|jgi:hypothetical protein